MKKVSAFSLWMMIFLLGTPVFSQEVHQSSTLDIQKNKFSPNVGFWWEVYNESFIIEKFKDNLIMSSHIKPGLRISGIWGMTAELYFLARYGKDLQRDFWNNKTETGFGLRIKMLRKVFLAPYVEWLTGFYGKIPDEFPQPPQKKYTDLRAGLLFWYGWDKYETISSFFSLPMLFWGEIYSDISYNV